MSNFERLAYCESVFISKVAVKDSDSLNVILRLFNSVSLMILNSGDCRSMLLATFYLKAALPIAN